MKRLAVRMNMYIFMISVLLSLGTLNAWSEPTNIILLIGDGMGFEQVAAAGMYANGAQGTLFFEGLPYHGEVTTYSASSSVTDSAAAATAIATGRKVSNGVISIANPGNGSELQTLLEYFKNKGKSTGLVTTTYMTHGTPAAFGAHEASRDNTGQIALDYLHQSRPDVLFGGGGYGMSVSAARAAGYTVVTNYSEMQNLNTDTVTMVSGQFGNGELPYEYDYSIGIDNAYDTLPHLSEMTATALDILDNDPDGFFLMVEGGLVDWAGHLNDLERNIFETLEFNTSVQTVYDWARDRSDTLILVTADHETGGMRVLRNNGAEVFPFLSWSTGGHTSANVPIYAWGVNAEMVSGVIDNTDLFGILTAGEAEAGTSLSLLYTDKASWEAQLSEVEVFTTVSDSLYLADELTSPPAMDAQLGNTLTFPKDRTGLSAGFVIEALQSGAGFTFSDTEGGVPLPGFDNALAVGDNDDFEDDDWRLSLLDGDTMTAIGFEIRHARFAPGESITLYYRDAPVSEIDLSSLPQTGNNNYFIGIISDVPFDSIIFNEDPDGDDIAIADFHFASSVSSETGPSAPEITDPLPDSLLSDSSVNISWRANGTEVQEWWLYMGTSPGNSDIYDSGSLGSSTSITVVNLPRRDGLLYLRLWYLTGSSWLYEDVQYRTSADRETESGIPGAFLYTDQASWQAQLTEIEVFTTVSDSLYLADELSAPPASNAQLGNTLTFPKDRTGLSAGFVIESLQSGAGFTFSDTEGGVPLPGFDNALAVGDNDDFEDDDWRLSLLDGDTMTAIGFEIRHARFAPGESIILYYRDAPVSEIDLSSLPQTGNNNYFIGIISDVPFDSIIFNEDPDGDDIAIADFRFEKAERSLP